MPSHFIQGLLFIDSFQNRSWKVGLGINQQGTTFLRSEPDLLEVEEALGPRKPSTEGSGKLQREGFCLLEVQSSPQGTPGQLYCHWRGRASRREDQPHNTIVHTGPCHHKCNSKFFYWFQWRYSKYVFSQYFLFPWKIWKQWFVCSDHQGNWSQTKL